MTERRSKAMTRQLATKPDVLLPPGTPHWVTAELLKQTLEVWQPFYQAPLTTEDALQILTGASRLLQVFAAELPAKPAKLAHQRDTRNT